MIEVPDGALGGTNIGVWGTTIVLERLAQWMPGDQMGRPAINTVFNTSLVDANAGADQEPVQHDHARRSSARPSTASSGTTSSPP